MKSPHSPLRAVLAAAVIFAAGAVEECRATQVDWSGVVGAVNLTSSGAAWDASWVLELGSFADGFVPTAGNTAGWAAKWRAASRSRYNAAARYFGGSYFYTANTAPFLTTTQAYVWAFNPAATDGEWILLTNPAWKWPAGSNSPFTLPVNWTSSDATQVVVGQLAAPGWTMKSAKVPVSPLPPLGYAAWKMLYFTETEQGNAAISGDAGDPDKDGLTNIDEYLYGGQPLAAGRPVATGISATTPAGRLELRLGFQQRALFTATPQFSPDLTSWTGSAADIFSTAPGELLARDPVAATGRRFGRWKLLLTP